QWNRSAVQSHPYPPGPRWSVTSEPGALPVAAPGYIPEPCSCSSTLRNGDTLTRLAAAFQVGTPAPPAQSPRGGPAFSSYSLMTSTPPSYASPGWPRNPHPPHRYSEQTF